ncbi:MAG: LuxR C-terminal-related transcriptional regulator [Acidimicrobiales bacterium]
MSLPISGSLGLPARLTRFFGRDSERAGLEAVLSHERLVTLTGAPGCGKTRLGIEIGSRLASRFGDGVWFVELAPVVTPKLTANAVGTALGVGERPGRPMEDTLVEALEDRQLLLILDNCEHVVEAAAALAGRLLELCPAVRVLATSRMPLGLPGEQVWAVTPLELDAAVELFTDRARLASSDSPVDDVSRSLLTRICSQVDGLPLAIELAAAWTRVLSLRQIADRLDHAVGLLKSRARTPTARQATMEASVDWSYRLLPAADQQLFDRLSVFTGGFDLAAAEAVAGPGTDVLAGLTALVDHSLVLTEPASDDPMRYRLLEPVRQCGAAWLGARGETDALRRRHAEHYLAVAGRFDVELREDRRAVAFHRLEQEEGNLTAALAWAREQHRPDLGLRLGAALAQFWELRGRVNEGRAWLEDMLSIDGADPDLRATALARAGRLAWRQRDYLQARALLEESLGLASEVGDQPGMARRLRSIALVVMSEGDPEGATRLCEQSVAIFRRHEDHRGLVWALIFLGLARITADDLIGGIAHIREALTLNCGLESLAATAYANLCLSHAAGRLGDVTAERAHLTDAVAALNQMGGVVEEPDWLWAGAQLAASERRLHTALRVAGGAEALSRRSGSHLHERILAALSPRIDDVRAEVGPAVADRLAAEGSRMSVDELMAEAFAERDGAVGDATADPLSPREREVAQLVGRGLTNGAIAEHLFISRRTVESHVDHIKHKLGLVSRNEVMAWVLRQSFDPTP